MRLRQLDADGAAADDDEVAGASGQVKDGFIGEVRNFAQALDRRHKRGGAGGDDIAAGADFVIARQHRVLVLELRLSLDDLDAQSGEALHRIHRGDFGDHSVNMCVDAFEIDLRLDVGDAELRAMAQRMRLFACGDQRFGRNAAIVEAVAAHLALFDEHDRNAE